MLASNLNNQLPLDVELFVNSVADLGAAIRKRRQEAGLPLAIAAPSCGVSVKFLQALETGKPTVQFDKAVAVARQFGIRLVIA